MDERELRHLVDKLRREEISEDTFLACLRGLPFRDLGEVKLDTHRALRNGFSEIVYCPGKSPDQLRRIAEALADGSGPALFSRMTEKQRDLIAPLLEEFEYFPLARMGRCGMEKDRPREGRVLVVTGGSSDVPVAEEAALTADTMGCTVERLYDVGVAGLHRLLAHFDDLHRADAIVAVAGMDGALPGVVAGLVASPVFAIPTSVGYGAALGGIGPLLTMLNACALGVSVVNIDNGVGGGYAAAQVARRAGSLRKGDER